MYKLYIVRIFDPPLSVSSKFTYKVFVLTHTSKIEIRKKYSVSLTKSIMVALLLCKCQLPLHFAHIQQRRTLLWVRLLLCFDLS
nr:MAG TPA: hypothetical protein [Caudoviricetes sp.]